MSETVEFIVYQGRWTKMIYRRGKPEQDKKKQAAAQIHRFSLVKWKCSLDDFSSSCHEGPSSCLHPVENCARNAGQPTPRTRLLFVPPIPWKCRLGRRSSDGSPDRQTGSPDSNICHPKEELPRKQGPPGPQAPGCGAPGTPRETGKLEHSGCHVSGCLHNRGPHRMWRSPESPRETGKPERNGYSPDLQARRTWVLIPAPPLVCCGTLGSEDIQEVRRLGPSLHPSSKSLPFLLPQDLVTPRTQMH